MQTLTQKTELKKKLQGLQSSSHPTTLFTGNGDKETNKLLMSITISSVKRLWNQVHSPMIQLPHLLGIRNQSWIYFLLLSSPQKLKDKTDKFPGYSAEHDWRDKKENVENNESKWIVGNKTRTRILIWAFVPTFEHWVRKFS